MARILHIESSTHTCSVAVAIDGNCAALCESHDAQYSHAEKLAVFMKQAMEDAHISPIELDAVCVAKGPGSYTGLRIGVSAAKGLCYGLDIPLLSVGSLESLAQWAVADKQQHLSEVAFLCPMIDARRMEVYTQVFDGSLNPTGPVSAVIIDENSFSDQLHTGKVAFFGDGASKCKEIIAHPNAVFLDELKASARGMITLAESRFSSGSFEDVAYFEPYYLKDFVAGKPKKMF